MSKVLAPILFLIAAIGLFFTYLQPGWDVLLAFQAQADRLDASIEKTKGLLETHNKLLTQYNEISPENIARLNKILPDRIDVVRMIMDIDTLTTKHKLTIKSFDIPDMNGEVSKTSKSKNATVAEEGPVGSAVLTVECVGEYQDFKAFVSEIESSLSLMDVVILDITVADLTQPGAVREITYKVGLQAYWLK
jgi:Tfp pilus assembly protein PilO